jgi:ribosomal protein S18 acetylase RimI-like enzyme
MMVEYKKINASEKKELTELVYTIQEGLERKEFFVPFSDNEIDLMFDESKTITYGAYINNKLIGTGQFYLGDEFVDEIKAALDIEDAMTGEFGGVLVLPEYRGNGIMKQLASILLNEAKKRNYSFIVSVAHPENIASNKSIVAMGAKLMKTDFLGEYYVFVNKKV